MRAKQFSIISVAAAALLSAGCLQKDTTHTVYLSPDGAVTWTTVEKDVYSDCTEARARQAEEQQYLTAATAGSHEIALALNALGPVGIVRTHVIREQRPFFVVTAAPYDSVERLLQQLFDENGISATVRLTREGSQQTLRVHFNPFVPDEGREAPSGVLLHDFDKIRFVLTAGRFVSAAGFTIDGPAATLTDAWLKEAENAQENAVTDLVLTWAL